MLDYALVASELNAWSISDSWKDIFCQLNACSIDLLEYSVIWFWGLRNHCDTSGDGGERERAPARADAREKGL